MPSPSETWAIRTSYHAPSQDRFLSPVVLGQTKHPRHVVYSEISPAPYVSCLVHLRRTAFATFPRSRSPS
ncbi:hypothetical protein VTJ49DRAFT_7112 [Mycothermus thermophilus]|uniref:Uncharacterized protein n=1 Tax=Humicola insolens TaxID=85995 RepID=A0ABR3VII1_HUMIN